MDDYSILDAELPTMVVRYKNTLVLRSIITGQHLQVLGAAPNWAEESLPESVREKSQRIEREYIKALEAVVGLMSSEDVPKTSNTKPSTIVSERYKSPANPTELPPCKVQRNYCCTLCAYYTQNPRSHLLHQRDVHGIRLSIHSCQHCQYASRYCQKLKRHIKMVHTTGSSQGSVIKVDKPSERILPNQPKEITAKPLQLPAGISKTLPVVEPTTKPNIELPSCSQAVTTQPSLIDAKNDPEAFFVSAYKNQLQKQLEYEQRLKNLLKSYSTEPKNTPNPNPSKIPKISKEVPTTAAPSQINQSMINKQFSNTESILPDMKIDLEKKRMYSCRKCSYITHIKSRYNKHVKYHSMPMIQCDKCEFRTTYKWNLTRHLRSHHGNGFYKCSVCTFSANMKQSLTSHEANHHSPPVGRAVGSKTIRKRRCRVGGSDLQPHNNNNNSNNVQSNQIFNSIIDKPTNNISELQNPITSDSVEPDTRTNGPITAEYDINAATTSTSNEIIVQETQSNVNNNMNNNNNNNNDDSPNMDFTDTENFDLESFESSDMEFNASFNDNNLNMLPGPPKTPPIHVDADFLDENLGNHSFYTSSNSSRSSRSPEKPKETYRSEINESKGLHFSNGVYPGYPSESSLSATTLSADEAFDRNSSLPDDTNPQSSSESENDIKSETSSSISSDDSLSKSNDENRREIEFGNDFQTSLR